MLAGGAEGERTVNERRTNERRVMQSLRVLVACEESQAVTTEFRKRGHEAYSCDLLPCGGGILNGTSKRTH